MRSILILFVLVLTSCTRVEPKMTVISNKEKFVIENFAKSVTAAEFIYLNAKTLKTGGMVSYILWLKDMTMKKH